MFKRVTIVALVVAAFLVLAVPALAFNGMRGDYTTTEACQTCHSGIAGIPVVYPQWSLTKHAIDEEADSAAKSLPTGSVCAGCHTANYSPAKVIPTPTATTTAFATPFATPPVPTATATAYGPSQVVTSSPQALGDAPFSENFVGCSSCHYGANVSGGLAQFGVDANDTAHNAPYGRLANADICGACHSRYSYTVNTIAITPVPTTSAIATIQPQMAIGYPMLSVGTTVPLSSYLNVPYPGWTPNPSATSAGTYNSPSLMKYWKLNGSDTPWQLVGHDGSAAQYPEWASSSSGHAQALTTLTSQPFWGFLPEAQKQQCLECHSADFRIMKEAGKKVTSADVKYGITCVGCHTPHDAGNVRGVWDEGFDAQLRMSNPADTNGSNLCTQCHNAELPVGTEASPGAEIHHPMKEMMDGYGAIDVAAFPSVHKGKCIQCHMPPTSWSRGSVQKGGNHTFRIIDPEVAVDASPIPVATTVANVTTTPEPTRTLVTQTTTVSQDSIPYSACSTCHNNNQKPTAVPVATVTTLATPSAAPTSIKITVTANVANQGDKALWLQNTIDQRQEWTTAKIAEIHSALKAAAVRLGYADEAAAQAALVAIPAANRSAGQNNFLKAFTNVGFVESEGSLGLHNWDYSRQIVNTALWQANSVEATPAPSPWSVAFKASKTSVRRNTSVRYSGTVAPATNITWGRASVTIQRKTHSRWRTWKTVVLNGTGAYSLNVRMSGRGKFVLRVLMPEQLGMNMLQGVSRQRTVRVR